MRSLLCLILCTVIGLSLFACAAPDPAVTETETEGTDQSGDTIKETETEKITETETEKETMYAQTLENLFDKDRAEPGWYNGSGQTSPDGAFCSSELIEVFEEDTVEFGAAVATQGWHMVIYNEQQQPIGDCTLSKGLTVLDTVDDQTVLISYTVPVNVWYVRLICDARYKDTYLVTVNQPFTVADFIDYFNLTVQGDEKETPAVKTDSVLYGKKALFIGDSICYGQWDNAKRLSWPGRIAQQYGLKSVNQAIGGTCMSTVRGAGAQIINQLTSQRGKSFDYIIIQGGVNDAWGTGDAANKIAPVGKMTDSFDEKDFDITTFAGGLEQLFARTIQYWPDAQIGFIISFNMPGAVGIGRVTDMEDYWAEAIKICEKWGIDYLDLYHDSYVSDTLLQVTTNVCLRDPIHPNELGYDRLAPYIGDWMEKIGS